MLLEGLSAESETLVNWDHQSDVVVRMSRNLSYVLRHSAEVRYDSEGFVRLLELMNARRSVVNKLLTPSKLLVATFANPKQRVQVSFPTYRVSGSGLKQYVMPDIGHRAVQGHSTRGDICLEYLIAAQDKLTAEQKDLPFLCVHGTDHTAWKSILQTH